MKQIDATTEDTVEAAKRYDTIRKIERSVDTAHTSSSGPVVIENFSGHFQTVRVPPATSKKRGRG
jgi:hypothetical protein